MIGPALLDNSAWQRLRSAILSRTRSEEVGEAIAADRIFASTPFILEAGYSARDAEEHQVISEALGSLPFLRIDAEVESAALRAQADLSRMGHHRLPPVDLIIAALARRHSVGVLHYDRNYDRINELTHLSFESVWLAQPGSL